MDEINQSKKNKVTKIDHSLIDLPLQGIHEAKVGDVVLSRDDITDYCKLREICIQQLPKHTEKEFDEIAVILVAQWLLHKIHRESVREYSIIFKGYSQSFEYCLVYNLSFRKMATFKCTNSQNICVNIDISQNIADDNCRVDWFNYMDKKFAPMHLRFLYSNKDVDYAYFL